MECKVAKTAGFCGGVKKAFLMVQEEFKTKPENGRILIFGSLVHNENVMKIINGSVDQVRREEAKTNPILKKTRYIFLKNEDNLTKKQLEKKQELLDMKDVNLKSITALQMRENFQQIYHAEDKKTFVALLESWYLWVSQSGMTPMEDAAKTIKNHWDGIVAWKESQINNGILEGLNSVVQAAKRKARGYGRKHFKTIAYLMTGKLDFTKINKYYSPT